MSLLDGFTRNWADLSEESPDPGLRAVVVPLPPDQAVPWAAALVDKLARWTVESAIPESGRLHATHRTVLWRFIDDIRLEFRPDDGGGTIITGQSRSRIGKGDLGQNARNLRELTGALRSGVEKLAPKPGA
jgi:uncharacterized protein (DUF1499 family)